MRNRDRSRAGSTYPTIGARPGRARWGRASICGPERRKGQEPRPAQYEFVLTTDVAPSRLYASRGVGRPRFRSDDRGATWRNVLFQSMKSPGFNVGPNYLIDERGGGGDTISGFGINPADPDNLVVADWMDCYITGDGGKNWETAHTRAPRSPVGAARGCDGSTPGWL